MKMSNAYEMPNLRFTGVTATEVPLRRFVAVQADERFKLAGDMDVVLGASLDHCSKAGQALTVADGIVIVEADEAITAGAAVMSVAGKAKVLTTGKSKAGICLTGATAAGQYITVKL